MSSFGESGFKVRIYQRGRIWYAEYAKGRRRTVRSLRTTDESEARGWAEKQAAALRAGRRYLQERRRQVLYVIQRGKDGPIKVGITRDVRRRMGELQVGSAEPLRVIAVYNMRQVERALHLELDEFRMAGEWFEETAAHRLRIFMERPRPAK